MRLGKGTSHAITDIGGEIFGTFLQQQGKKGKGWGKKGGEKGPNTRKKTCERGEVKLSVEKKKRERGFPLRGKGFEEKRVFPRSLAEKKGKKRDLTSLRGGGGRKKACAGDRKEEKKNLGGGKKEAFLGKHRGQKTSLRHVKE